MTEGKDGRQGHPDESIPGAPHFFLSRRRQLALDALLRHLHAPRGGIVLLSGPEGVGKSALAAHLLAHCLGDAYLTAVFAAPPENDHDFVPGLLARLRIQAAEGDYQGLFQALQRHAAEALQRGQRCLLVIDRAEALSDYQKQVLGYLAQLHQDGEGLFKGLLLAPETAAHELARDPALAPHLLGTVTLAPFDEDETARYLQHRARLRGLAQAPTLDATTLETLLRATGGLPGAIDRLFESLIALAPGGGDGASPTASRPDPEPPRPPETHAPEEAIPFDLLPDDAAAHTPPAWATGGRRTAPRRPKAYGLLALLLLALGGGAWLWNGGHLQAWLAPGEAHARHDDRDAPHAATETHDGSSAHAEAPRPAQGTTTALLQTLSDDLAPGEDMELLDLHRLIARREAPPVTPPPDTPPQTTFSALETHPPETAAATPPTGAPPHPPSH